MPTAEESRVSDAAELQNVLTRYVDSYDGYTHAAEVVDSPTLAAAFLEIAERRKSIVQHVAALIVRQGGKADPDGSPEAILHRWWMQIRAKMTDEEFKATLAECVRGEKELARTIQSALEHGGLDSENATVVAEVSAELKETLHTFEMVLDQ